MIIHLLAPKEQYTWHPIWGKCYSIWKTSPYEIKLWNDEDIDQLLKEDNEEFFNILNTLPPIYKFDYVRYVILEKFGGAYFDMDIEIIDPSFIPKLNPNKFYYMEGTLGTFIDNSLIISSKVPKYNQDLFHRIKTYTKRLILNNLDECTPFNVIKFVGPYALSDWVSRYQSQTIVEYEILGQYQFSSPTNEVAYTRHHQTSVWNK